MNAMLAASLPIRIERNLHLPEISDSDGDLDSSTIAYSPVSLSFCKLGLVVLCPCKMLSFARD